MAQYYDKKKYLPLLVTFLSTFKLQKLHFCPPLAIKKLHFCPPLVTILSLYTYISKKEIKNFCYHKFLLGFFII